MLYLNQKVNIKPEAWRQFLIKNGYPDYYPNIGEQVIIKIEPNYGGQRKAHYLLAFPHFWWNEEDLETIEEIIYEKVDEIKIKNQTVRLGDKLRCLCRYEVNALAPVWDSKTGKHLPDHYNNSFQYKLIKGCLCPIHR